MLVPRRSKAEQSLKVHLTRRRGEKVIAANDEVDVHGRIVDGRCELVGENPIGATKDEVADLLRHLLAERSAEHIANLERGHA